MSQSQNVQLKHAADDLLTLLQKSESALDTVARKLEDEFAARSKTAGLNPLLLSKRIQRLCAQIPALKGECQDIIQRKQALIDAAKQQLLANRSQLVDLSSKCSLLPAEEDQEVLADFTEALAAWDKQAGCHSKELAGQPTYMSRQELNHALAGSILARH